MKRLLLSCVCGLVLTFSLASCSTSSAKYIDEIRGYAVTRGRITKIENLHAEELQSLSDGLAMTLVENGCRVTMKFDADEEAVQIFDIGEGVILVHGYDSDYILESRSDGTELAQP